jgi:Uma2 family endonuclease
MAIPQHRLTLEEFLALPEEKPALEFEDGEVTQKVSPRGRHGRLQSAFSGWVNRHAEPRKWAMAFTETRFTVAGVSRVPDVSVYRWDRIPRAANGEVADDFFIAPDVAVEIRSPEQSRASQIRRCHWYVANGVRLALFVDPDARAVWVFRPGVDVQVARGDDAIDLGEIVPDLRLSVAELFGWLSAV